MISIFNDTFKTIRIHIHKSVPVSKKDKMTQKLLAQLISVANAQYPTRQSFVQRLETLYGMSLHTFTQVLGNQALFQSNIKTIHGSFVSDETLLKEVLHVTTQTLFHQTLTNHKLFDQEKRLLIHQLESIKNHKSHYASALFKDTLFKDIPGYATLEEDLEALHALTIDQVKTYYDTIFIQAPTIAFVTGPLSDKDQKLIKDKLSPYMHGEIHVQLTPLNKKGTMTETKTLEMNQSIMHFAYHLPIYLQDEQFAAAQIMNEILGAHGDSKLFRIVREEKGLCYIVGSHYDPYHGVLIVMTGVDIHNQDIAKDAILNVVESMTQHISDKELDDAKQSMIHTITSNLDNQTIYIDRAFRDHIFHRTYDLEKRLNEIREVTKDDVKQVASRLTLLLEHRVTGEKHA